MKTTSIFEIVRRKFLCPRILFAVLFSTICLGGAAVQAADTVESWQSASAGFTNPASWSPAISSPGGITNWPNNFNGNAVDYSASIIGANGNASGDACLYTNTDINGTNVLGQLAIGGGIGAGVGGGCISNAFIMTGGELTVTDFTASAAAGYAFTMGGENVGVSSVPDTNYFIMTGGIFNSTNASGGNNWIGTESNSVNFAYFDGGTVNLDGLFMGGYGKGTVTINGSTVNLIPAPSGGGTPGAISFGWEPGNSFTVNLMSGALNITNESPSINFHANTKSVGVFTLNVSGGTLNASELNFGNTPNGVATNLMVFSGGNINLGSGGIASADTANNTNLIILSGGTFSTLPGQNWTFSTSANPIVNVLTNTGTNVVFAPLAGQTITLNGLISGPGALNCAGPGTTIVGTAMQFTGGLPVTGGTLAIGAAQTQSLGLSLSSGGALQINNINNALVDNPIPVPAGSSLVFSNTGPILFPNTVTGGGSLVMKGGAVTNTGNLQYTGDTFVNAGDLVVNGSGALSGPLISVAAPGTLDLSQLSSVNLSSGQTLSGNGTVIGPASGNLNFNSGSTLAVGLSSTNTYTLTIENNLVLAAGSTNYVVVNKSPAIANDEVMGLTSVAMGGTILITNIGTTAFAAGDVIPIFSATSYNTNGFNILPATPGAGLVWSVTNGTIYVLGAGANPNAPSITNEPVSATVNPGQAFTNTVGVSGAQPLYYQWYQSPSGIPVPNATNASLIFNPVTPADATNYYVVVTNIFGPAVSVQVTLTVNSTPTILTEFPVTYTNNANTNYMNLYAGADPAFSVTASSVQPPSVFYQWYTNGIGIVGAIGTTLTLSNVPTALQSVVCVVTNGGGAATNMVWATTVMPDPVNSFGSAPYPGAVLALNPVDYWRLNEPESGNGDAGVIAYDYAGGNDALYTNVVLGNNGYNPTTDPSDTSAEFGSYATYNSYAGSVGTNVDVSQQAGSNAEFSVECWVNFTRNTVCGLVTKGYGNGGEEFSLDNDSGSLPRFLVRTADGASYVATSVGAPFTPSTGVWYDLVGVCDEANSNILFYVNGQLSAITNASGLFQGGILSDLSENLIIGARTASLAAAEVGSNGNQTVGYMNDVALFNYALSPAQIANEYQLGGGAPFLSQQPGTPVYIGKGSNLVVTALAQGAPVLSYQWYETNLTAQTGFAVSGQTNASLVISNIQASDNYFLIVTNPYGSTNSIVVTVGVYSSPLFTGEFPVTYTNTLNTNDMTVYAGASPTFSVVALGFGSLAYQWFTNGAAMGGATNPAFTWSTVQGGTDTAYCIVTNSQGSATSAVWAASVIAAPQAPYPQSVLALNPIGYWRLNEGNDNGDGDDGYLAFDYAGGNNGIYTNVLLGQSGYNPTADPSDTSADFGYDAANNCDANSIGTNIDFSTPAGSNAEFSVECWVNFQENTVCGLVTKGYGNGGEEFCMDADASGGVNFKFFVRGASGTAYTCQSAFTPALSTWYHMAGVCDEAHSNAAYYIDGKLAASVTIPPGSGILNDRGSSMIIGARPSSLANAEADNANNQTVGFMNDVALFNYALNPGQVANQYDAGGGTIVPYFVPTAPSTNAGAAINSTLTIPVAAVGTPPIGFLWTNLTTSATIAQGVTNSPLLNATLNVANIPASWNTNQLELIVTNAYGTTNVLVTLSITNGINPNPTNIVFAVTNHQLLLSWPADHTGWQLQSQTNNLSVGISTNWVNVSGTTATNAVLVPINLTNGSVFYRLIYP